MSTPVGAEPSSVICPSCHQQVTTRTEPRTTTKTHLIALILCLFGCCPCALCLYCTDCARNTEHYCPSCQAFIGTFER
ncbi:lipopolysaccharide-induced tumor necrosis factor-alpha factor homolog [Scaptodrosophila lebanonensis]|uniref:Lipopolysaccharide-induced tumor necrosis factor-alpha factor homolog n=1 Tax=Drosophila lebanonensis TaxID=7225 RepID=A0A6J2UIJ8_DROLE|nr:lipopolysaccharide-induced tumor necrosis factor-alpha factor homolog [Scaptodrosophila lebanonensis]